MEDQDGSGEDIQPRRNLEEIHMKIQENVKSKISKYLEPLLQVPSAEKYHWWFALMLDPQYFNELVDFRTLHKIYSIDTRTIINKMMPKFYDYIVAAELAENPYTTPYVVTTANQYLYFNEENVGETRTSSRGGINILRDMIESVFKVFCNAADATSAIKNEEVLTWCKEHVGKTLKYIMILNKFEVELGKI